MFGVHVSTVITSYLSQVTPTLLNTGRKLTMQTVMQRHAMVMGSTWGMLIPAAILMARLRNKKGWWFQLHRALATASLVLVVVGAVLGRRLRLTHPPVTTAGTLHKFLGYTALTFICLQVGTSILPSFCNTRCLAASLEYFQSCS